MRTLFQVSLLSLSVVAALSSCADLNRNINSSRQDPAETDAPRNLVDEPFLNPVRLEFDTLRSFPTPLPRIGRVMRKDPVDRSGNPPTTGGFAGIDSLTTESPPHLQVAFNLVSVENVSFANGGTIQNMRINWWTHSSTATWESDWSPSSYIPNPGSMIQP